MEADAKHKGVVQDPVHQTLDLLLPVPDQLRPGPAHVPPPREAPVEVLVVDVMPGVRRVAVRVCRGHNVEISCVNYSPDPLVTLVIVCQVSGENKKQASVTMRWTPGQIKSRM